ncbi:Mor transcription activator family protein [compost metagenome]
MWEKQYKIQSKCQSIHYHIRAIGPVARPCVILYLLLAPAREPVLAEVHCMGGCVDYIPSGEHPKMALRDRAIRDEFNSRNIAKLGRQHGLPVA